MMNKDILKEEVTLLLNKVDRERLKRILKSSLWDALKVTAASKGRALAGMAGSIFKGAKATGGFIAKESWKAVLDREYFRKIPQRVGSFTGEKINLVKMASSNFARLEAREKATVAVDAGIFFFFMLISGGGKDFEGGIPDQDLKLGIGKHRNLFSHTVLLPLTLEVAARFIVGVAREYRDDLSQMKYLGGLLEEIIDFVDSREDLIIGGMWAGISIHLLKDAGIFQKYIKPYSGLSGLSMNTHKSIFLGNSFLALFFSGECIGGKNK